MNSAPVRLPHSSIHTTPHSAMSASSLAHHESLQPMMDNSSSGNYYHTMHSRGQPGQQQQQHPAAFMQQYAQLHSQPQSQSQAQAQAQAQAQVQAQAQAQAHAQAHAQAQAQSSQDRAALEALAGSAAEKQSQLQGSVDRSFDTKYNEKCPLPECKDLPTFTRPCEYKKHKDKHDRPYVCSVDGCPALGFTYKGGLIRHEKEVHKRNTKTGYRCSFPGCTRVTSFTRRENFVEHLKRIHKQHLTGPEIENLRPSRESSPEPSNSSAGHHGGPGSSNGLHQNPNSVGGLHDVIDPSIDLRPRKRHHRANSGQGPNGVTAATSTQSTPNMIMPGNQSVIGSAGGPQSQQSGGGIPYGNGSVAASMGVSAADMGGPDVRHTPTSSRYGGLTVEEVIMTQGRIMEELQKEVQILKARERERNERIQKLEAVCRENSDENRTLKARMHLLEVQVPSWMGQSGHNGIKPL